MVVKLSTHVKQNINNERFVYLNTNNAHIHTGRTVHITDTLVGPMQFKIQGYYLIQEMKHVKNAHASQ